MSFFNADSPDKQFVSTYSWIIENPERLKAKSKYTFESETVAVEGTPFFWYAKVGEDPENSQILRMDVFLNQVSGTSTRLELLSTLVYDYEVTIPRANQDPKVMSLWKRPIQSSNKSFLNLAKMRHLDFLLIDGVLRLDIKLTIAEANAELFTSLEPEIKRGTKQKNLLKRSDDEHIKNLLNDLGHLLETGFFSDVSIIVGEEEFKVHKAILAARSDVFRQNFNKDSSEKEESFSICNCSAETFKHFLKFAYTGRLESCGVDHLELMALAGKFRIKNLGEMCLIAMRKPGNVKA